MEKREFGKTGYSVSVLGFGAGPIGYLETDLGQVERTVNTLLDSGVNLLDTAAAYHGSEEALGKAVAHRRNEFFLVSKCGQAFDDLPGEAWSAELITATVDRSLKRLKTDRLDLMLLHSCDLPILERGDAINALVKARQAGKIRFVGYSGDNEAAVFAARHPEIAVLETSVNICDQANISGVLPIARQNNMGVLAKRPIANTAWRPLNQLQGIYTEYARPYHERFKKMNISPSYLGFTSEADWPEIALRFTLSQPGVHVAIIGTTNPVNAKRNIDAAAKGPLPERALEEIRAAFAKASSASGQPWPGLT